MIPIHTCKTDSITDVRFAELIGKFECLLQDQEIAHKVIAVKIEDVIHFMAACCAVFQLQGIVLPLDSVHTPAAPIDLLITDDACDGERFAIPNVVIADVRVIAGRQVTSDSRSIGDIMLSDYVSTTLIPKAKMNNWVAFHQDVWKTDCSNTLFFYENNKDFFSFIWALPVCMRGNLSIAHIDADIDLKDITTVIMPLAEVDKMLGKRNHHNKTLITYGNELMEYASRKETFSDRSIQWLNYYGFPYVTWLSAAKPFIVNGKRSLHHEIKPIKNIQVSVINEAGQYQPYHAIGSLAETTDGSTVATPFRGVMEPDGTIISIGCAWPILYKNRAYLHTAIVEKELTAIEFIKDYYVDSEHIYYVANSDKSAYELDAMLCASLPGIWSGWEYTEVPYLPRDGRGQVNTAKLTKMNGISYSKLNAVRSEIHELGIDNAIQLAFQNAEPCLVLPSLDRVIDSIETTDEQGSPCSPVDAYIHAGALDYKKQHTANLTELLAKRAAGTQQIVYIEQEGRLAQSYREMYEEARRLAGGLRAMGVRENDKVILQLSSNKDYLEIFWACIWIGAVVAPLAVLDDYGAENVNTQKLKDIYGLLGDPFIVSAPELVEPISRMNDGAGRSPMKIIDFASIPRDVYKCEPYEWEMEAPCMLMFTSGSTGVPKGVMLSQRNIFARTLAEIEMYGFNDNDVDLNWMTLTHAAGLVWTHIRDMYLDMLQIQVKSELILRNPLLWISLMNEYQATITWAPNFAYALVTNELEDAKDYGWDLSRLKSIFATAEANVSKTLRKFVSRLQKYQLPEDAVKPAFGMTETTSVMIYNNHFALSSTSDDDKFVPIGTPAPGHEFRVVNDAGEFVKEGVVGHIEGRGEAVTQGYFNNEKANEDAFTADGFFRTGDLGYILDNRIILTGRAKDVIIINGLNYYVQDIETAVDELEDVHASFTVATSVTNKDGQEEILIIFSPKDESVLENVAALREIVSNIKKEVRAKCMVNPTYVVPVSHQKSIRTELGKKQRNKYRKAFWNGEYLPMLQRIEGSSWQERYIVEEHWQRKNRTGARTRNTSETIAVIADQVEFAIRLFKHSGLNVNIYREQDIPDIVERLIIDLAALEYSEEDPIEFACSMLAHLAGLSKRSGNLKLIIPSTHALIRKGDTFFSSTNSMLRGFVKSFNIEHYDKSCRLIDFDVFDPATFIEEVRSASKEEEVSYRDGQRYTSILKSIKKTDFSTPLIPSGSVILLLGGLGGIGRVLAKHLVANYNAKLIMFGSSGLEPEKQLILEELRSMSTNVLYRPVDIENVDEMESVLLECEQIFGQKTSFFINLAGKISASEKGDPHWSAMESHRIEQETPFSIREVLTSKVTSSLAIEKLRESRQNAVVIMFGSVNGYFGGTSLSAYSAANSFQDMYCRHLNNWGKETYCISWSTWADIGMSKDIPEGIRRVSSTSGFFSIPGEDNLRYLEYILNHHIHNAMVGIDRHAKKNHYLLHDKYEPKLKVYYTGDQLESVKRIIGTRIGGAMPVKYSKVVEIPRNSPHLQDIQYHVLQHAAASSAGIKEEQEHLSENSIRMMEIWKDVLKLSSVGIHDDFFDLGGNSILISRLLFSILDQFGAVVTFQDVINNSTIEKLIKLIQRCDEQVAEQESHHADELEEMLRRDAELQFPIEAYLQAAKRGSENKNLLLTGASGFLGAYLLTQLLKNTTCHIYCLVRAKSQADAEERIRHNLNTYGLQDEFIAERVTCLKGDISSLHLGWTEKEYNHMSETIDVIMHAAADVHFVSPYEKVRDINVEGTRKVIRFACHRKVKPLHYISSYTVYDSLPYHQEVIANERTKPELKAAAHLNGYTLTKIVADRLVGHANEQGLPCRIYRIGTVTGDTQRGRCQVKDFFWLLISASLKLKKLPAVEKIGFHLVPADTLAAVIIDLAQRPYHQEGQVYNLAYDKICVPQILAWLQQIEPDLQTTAYDCWLVELIEYASHHKDMALLSILGAFPAAQQLENASIVEVSSAFTSNLLKARNVNSEGMTFETFRKTYDYLNEIGFFS
ncbi:thioester reductase domain-containing protein [Paenibacillus sp. MER 180]|uniref:thioester reductase domain-containing protein n=1 Tax=Paenibacillus sp. MER 180 TaxID=2939570 RepID=UPI00203BCDE9|nr:thioester reductase domain-containing protein [Paenibacillus sp. MER 180]MCM3291426.1 thioester reductase domain-containing protein [Paenibacillus sp. MER 180]